MTKLPVKVKRIGNHSLPLPKYETEGASGFDLRAQLVGHWDAERTCRGVNGERILVLAHGEAALIGCGFAFDVPAGYELQVRPRSGLSIRGVRGTFGTVDSDYRGEVKLHVRFEGPAEQYVISDGSRLAQGVIAPVVRAELVEAEELSETARGGNGFGSTGSI